MSTLGASWPRPARSWPTLAPGLLVLSVGLSNLGNYAFNGWVSRTLAPEQFGVYGVALAAISVGAVPINVMRLAIVKETAAGFGSFRLALPRPLATHLRRQSGGHLSTLLTLALAIALAVSLVSPGDGRAPAVPFLAFLILGAMVLVYGGRGYLQGALRLGPWSLSLLIEHSLRLLAFGALILLSDGSRIPLVAILVGLLGSYVVTSRALQSDKQGHADGVGGQTAMRRLAANMAVFQVAYVAHTALFSADLILAGFFLDQAQVGGYAALSLAGRVILFANLGVAELVLPVAAMPRQRRPFLRRSMLLGAAIPLPVLLAYWLFPEHSLSALFGADVAGLAQYLPILGTAMYLLSVAGIVLSFLLARGLGWFAATVGVGAALLEVLLLLVRHADAGEIAGDVLIAATTYTLALLAILPVVGMLSRRMRTER